MKQLPNESAWTVEFPAVVENVRTAIGLMGGEGSLERVAKGEAASVKLEWMEGTHSVQSVESNFKGMHLRVREDGEAEVVAVVDAVHRFEELSDFAYVPMKWTGDDEFGKMGSVVSSQGRLFEKTVTEAPHFEAESMMPLAPRFSQIRHPVEALVKGKSVPTHVMKGRDCSII